MTPLIYRCRSLVHKFYTENNFSTLMQNLIIIIGVSQYPCMLEVGLGCGMNTIITGEALVTDSLKSRQLYLRPPSQNPVFLNSHTNSVFLHSRKLTPSASTV